MTRYSVYRRVLIPCASREETAQHRLICLSSDDVEEGRIQVNKVACNNLRVKLGDLVGVHSCLDIK
ncbi:hypothetical protein B0H13DRAFT_1660225 [Mycena leptocephala]|nr:hypothetical protein B0H13DRAFT_1660225 [Mycena leptocephala]